MKIALVNTITTDKLKRFKADGIDGIIFTRVEKSVNYDLLHQQFKLINAFENTSGANWYNYKRVQQKLASIRNRFPGIFHYKGYDLEIALNKDLFWSYLFTNALLYEKENQAKPGYTFINYEERGGLKKRLAVFRKLFLYKHRIYKMEVKPVADIKTRIGFRLNDPFMIDVYGELFNKLDRKNVLPFQTINNQDTRIVKEQMLQTFGLNFNTSAGMGNPFRLSFTQKVRLFFFNDPDFLNTLIYLQNTLCNHVDEYERLFKSGLKKIVLNAGENEGEGNVACLAAKKYGGITFNYMNGTKAKDPQNIETDFDYWFMPDQNTKDLLLSYCKITDKQLPVTGHVLRDSAEQHVYSGSMDAVLDKIKNKKIIALLTSRIYAIEKQQVLAFLTDYLQEHPDVCVLVRKHPSESDSDIPHADRIIPVPPYSERMVQKSLFDLFSVSDVAISFSSMVSYQASWFHIPSLNYELSEHSRLPFVDEKQVFQVDNMQKLKHYLDDYLFNGKVLDHVPEKSNASQNIATLLLTA